MHFLRPLLRQRRLTPELFLPRRTNYKRVQLFQLQQVARQHASAHSRRAPKAAFTHVYSDLNSDLTQPVTSEAGSGVELNSELNHEERQKAMNVNLICGNSVVLLDDGGRVLEEMGNAVDSAKDMIMMEMYWLASDKTGWRIATKLKNARDRGVQVGVVFDSFGCLETDKSLFDMLRECGCKVAEYNPLIGRSHFPKQIGLFLRRDHRKILVVDGNIAFTGGLNIANHWLPVDQGGDGWKDMVVRIEGPAASAFAQVTERMLNLLKHNDDDFFLSEYFKKNKKRMAVLKSNLAVARFEARERRNKLLQQSNNNATEGTIQLSSAQTDLVDCFEDDWRNGLVNKVDIGEQRIVYQKDKFVHLLPLFAKHDAAQLRPTGVSRAFWAAQGKLRKRFYKHKTKNTIPQNTIQEDRIGYSNEPVGGEGGSSGHVDDLEIPALESLANSELEKPSHSSIQLLTNDAWADKRLIRRGYLRAINAAREEILIVNGYFIPDRSIRRALYRAVKRGVKVRVIVPGKSDHELVRLAARARYQVWLRKGVELHEWSPTVLHSKVAVFDRSVSVVGTYNFDPLSFRSNLEICAVIHDSSFSHALAANIENDINTNCTPIQKNTTKTIADRVIIQINNWMVKLFDRVTTL